MLSNDNCSLGPTEFFRHLEKKTSTKSYELLDDYLKDVTKNLEDEQPAYILDLADILWKIQLWREKLPGVAIFFAVKANPDPILIQLLVLLGISFDCSTKGEIKLVLENGGDPKNIIYAHTVKPPSSLRYASEVGVDLLTFDSEEELNKIQTHHPNARLVIRIKPETPPRSDELSENGTCVWNLGEKYGCSVTEAENLLQRAKELKLKVVGVSFHVGALCINSSFYVKCISNCRLVYDMAQKIGFKFEIIDLGAGFFGVEERENLFDVVTTDIKSALKQHFSEKSVNIIAEPGCYLVASAGRHLTCVIGKRSSTDYHSNAKVTENDKNNEVAHREYFLNDGYYNAFFEHIDLYEISHRPLMTNQELKKRQVYKSKIWGQTCCSEDIIKEECLLPDMEVGEYLIWENMGAYTQGMSSTFTIVPPAVGKHVFIFSPRLQLEWIENLEEIAEFIVKNCVLIQTKNV